MQTTSDLPMQMVLELPAAADMHVHLRQGALMRMVTPKLSEGGVGIAYVMVRDRTSLPTNLATRDVQRREEWSLTFQRCSPRLPSVFVDFQHCPASPTSTLH